VDTQTRHALKNDKFAQATASSVSWVSGHRSSVLRWSIGAVAGLAIIAAGLIYLNQQNTAAETSLGAALDVYSAPLAQPGAPAEADSYATAADRAKAANQKFTAIASQYSYLPIAAKAHYFAGVTYLELGQNATAETELKTAAGAWNHDVANLATLALAGLYHQTARDSQAIDAYNALTAKPSETVSANSAQLALADLYASTGKQDQARAIWAKIKDADKDGSAGSIATEKLAAK
jgi:tetratricopeptide (TPR) repeat protein